MQQHNEMMQTLQTYVARVLAREQTARARAEAHVEQLTPDPELRELFAREVAETFERNMRATLRRCNIARRLCLLFRRDCSKADVSLWIQREDELMVRVCAHSRELTAYVDHVLECRDQFALLLCPLEVARETAEWITEQTKREIVDIFATGDDTHRELY
jgi:hypothetical protein